MGIESLLIPPDLVDKEAVGVRRVLDDVEANKHPRFILVGLASDIDTRLQEVVTMFLLDIDSHHKYVHSLLPPVLRGARVA